jgi:protein subunit release factor B
MIARMRFPDDAPVTPPKREALRTKLRQLGVDLATVDEQAVRAAGPGGQKVNKTSSGVLLRHTLGTELLVVKWTRERHHALNRFLALRELADQIELRISPETSTRLRGVERLRKQKDRRRRRAKRGSAV